MTFFCVGLLLLIGESLCVRAGVPLLLRSVLHTVTLGCVCPGTEHSALGQTGWLTGGEKKKRQRWQTDRETERRRWGGGRTCFNVVWRFCSDSGEICRGNLSQTDRKWRVLKKGKGGVQSGQAQGLFPSLQLSPPSADTVWEDSRQFNRSMEQKVERKKWGERECAEKKNPPFQAFTYRVSLGTSGCTFWPSVGNLLNV